MSLGLSSKQNGYILFLPTEVLYYLLDQLEDRDQKCLSWTCKDLYRLVRMNRFGVVSPFWEEAEITNSEILPASSYQNGVVISNILYIPVLSKDNPYCVSINFDQRPLKFVKNLLKLDKTTKDKYEPCKFVATAAIGNQLFIFGGENLYNHELSNAFYQLNINTFELKKNSKARNLPKARMKHSLNSIGGYKLALFGGRCYANGAFYDTRDFSIYDAKENSWKIIHNEVPFFPSRRSDHSTMFTNGKLYIFGGQQITSLNRRSYSDPDIWEYDPIKSKWRMYSNKTLPSFVISENLISTSGKNPSKKCGAAIFQIRKRIVILGGRDMNEWNNENNEFMKILSPTKHTWSHVRVEGMPMIECVAIFANCKVGAKDIFILGKDQKEEKLIMGWIRDKH